MRCCMQDEMNKEESGRYDVDGTNREADSTASHRWGDAYLKERLVICNEEDTDDQA